MGAVVFDMGQDYTLTDMTFYHLQECTHGTVTVTCGATLFSICDQLGSFELSISQPVICKSFKQIKCRYVCLTVSSQQSSAGLPAANPFETPPGGIGYVQQVANDTDVSFLPVAPPHSFVSAQLLAGDAQDQTDTVDLNDSLPASNIAAQKVGL
jgi:hypothetical protein